MAIKESNEKENKKNMSLSMLPIISELIGKRETYYSLDRLILSLHNK